MFTRKVQSGKLPVIFNGQRVVCPSSINYRRKISATKSLSVGGDDRSPFSGSLIENNSAVSASVIGPVFCVGYILRLRNDTNISKTIIQPVTVSVVDLGSGVRNAENEAVQLHCSPLPRFIFHGTPGIKRSSFRIATRMPFHRHQIIVLFDGNEGVHPSSQWKFSTREFANDIHLLIHWWTISEALRTQTAFRVSVTGALAPITWAIHLWKSYVNQFVKLTSRLATLLQQGHILTSYEMCGLAALGEF